MRELARATVQNGASFSHVATRQKVWQKWPASSEHGGVGLREGIAGEHARHDRGDEHHRGRGTEEPLAAEVGLHLARRRAAPARLQRVCGGRVVVQAARKAIHAQRQHVRLEGVEAPARWRRLEGHALAGLRAAPGLDAPGQVEELRQGAECQRPAPESAPGPPPAKDVHELALRSRTRKRDRGRTCASADPGRRRPRLPDQPVLHRLPDRAARPGDVARGEVEEGRGGVPLAPRVQRRLLRRHRLIGTPQKGQARQRADRRREGRPLVGCDPREQVGSRPRPLEEVEDLHDARIGRDDAARGQVRQEEPPPRPIRDDVGRGLEPGCGRPVRQLSGMTLITIRPRAIPVLIAEMPSRISISPAGASG